MIIISIIGLVFEITGVVLMASGYTSNMMWYEAPVILIKCFFKPNTIKGVTTMQELNDEKTIWVLRGLALIALGFVFQLFVVCSKLI